MRASRAALAGLLLSLLLCPLHASAECMMARPFISPAEGKLPTRATVYLFVPFMEAKAQPKLVLKGDARHKLERLYTSSAFTAFGLELTGKGAVAISVNGGPEHRYTLQEPYKPGPVDLSGLEITQTKKNVFAWTCSHQDTVDLTIDRWAPAYRLEWAKSEADFRAGRTQAAIFPSSALGFFRSASELNQPTMISLGHISCLSDTFAPRVPVVYVGLVGLFVDGSSTRAPSTPQRLDL